jgi:hypothetical protein
LRYQFTQMILLGCLASGNDVGDRPTPEGHANLLTVADRMEDLAERPLQLTDPDLSHVVTLTWKGPHPRSHPRNEGRADPAVATAEGVPTRTSSQDPSNHPTLAALKGQRRTASDFDRARVSGSNSGTTTFTLDGDLLRMAVWSVAAPA